ncbi:ABC-three component system middle component 1 [Lactococcus lactis]|uniref:Uncharacterized protein n=1 Tax=Lactococcus lactis subsp. lactis TaxID=1360 RepID=A0A0V8E8E1_LACLL|nr:ABC-three component system middle component 1 [Lactococcus lactis]KSU22110.1 hypothetical protein M20_0610 [Lactococcus lactis subsp. lactis]
MKLFEKLIAQINKSQFEEITLEQMKYTTFFNETNGKLIVIYSEQIMQDSSSKEDINNVAKHIRDSIKKENRFNLWNAYLLILVDKNSFNEKYYYIERDVRNLRKYVIQNPDDILRIPFINLLEDIKEQGQTREHNYSVSDDLQKLHQSLKEYGGYRKKLTRAEIVKSLEETMFLGGEND